MGTETIVRQGRESRAAVKGRGGVESQRKSPGSLALMTSSENDHAHSVRIFVMDARDGNVVGETSFSAGSTEDGAVHAHPFTLDMESGELRIGEALGHEHGADPDELSAMMASLREQMESGLVDEDMEPLMRSDDKGPGSRTARRSLSNVAAGFVSLCRRGMNGIRTLLKSDGRFSFQSNLSKMDSEGLLHTLVWVPDLPCHEGDVMTAEEVRKMAHNFLPNGGHIDIEHDGKPLDSSQVSIAEHYIVPPGDPKFQGIRTSEGVEIDPAGAWGLILKIHDPDIRADYESGNWDGVSLAGRAEVTPLGKSHNNKRDEFNMTPEDQTKFAEMVAEKLVTGLSEVLKQSAPEPKSEPKTEPDAVVATIEVPEDLDLNDPESLEKWQDELFVKSLNLSKREDVIKLAKHRREQAAKKAKEEAELQKQNKANDSSNGEGADGEGELEKARRERDEANARVEKLEKASKQSAKASSGDSEDDLPKIQGMTQEERAQAKVGLEIAKQMGAIA